MGGQPDMDKLIAEIQKLNAKIDDQEEARKRQETFATTVGDDSPRPSKREDELKLADLPSFDESGLDQQNKSDVLKTLKNKVTIGNSKEEASKMLVCFRCQGLGHVSKVCPNRTMVTRQEYYNFLMQNMDELVEARARIGATSVNARCGGLRFLGETT
ncbi:Chaperone protein DnaJ [Bienertia sinuspersici]